MNAAINCHIIILKFDRKLKKIFKNNDFHDLTSQSRGDNNIPPLKHF